MDNQFEKIMSIQAQRDGKPYAPFHLNHVREQRYGYCWDETPIPECEILVHVEGKTALYIGEQVYFSKRGTVVTCKPGEVHKMFVTGTEEYERYVLWFDFDYVKNLFEGAEESYLSMFIHREMFEKNVLQLPSHQVGRLLHTLEKAADYSQSDAPEAAGLFLAACLKSLAIISESYTVAVGKQGAGNYSPIVSMALEMIEKQFAELQNVETLAKRLHISNSYLARIFKRQVGTSVYEYIQNRKLAYAIQLLVKGKSVTEVCFDAGFNNYSYFIQLFKRKYGVTPHKYKKSLE